VINITLYSSLNSEMLWCCNRQITLQCRRFTTNYWKRHITGESFVHVNIKHRLFAVKFVDQRITFFSFTVSVVCIINIPSYYLVSTLLFPGIISSLHCKRRNLNILNITELSSADNHFWNLFASWKNSYRRFWTLFTISFGATLLGNLWNLKSH